MISLAAIPTDRPCICLRLRVLRWAAESCDWLPRPSCLPVVYQQRCHRQAADLWLFISSHPHHHPPTDGLWLFTQGEKGPKLMKYNKQEVIMGRLVVIAIYWSPEKMEIDPSLLIMCPLINVAALGFPLILITFPTSVCADGRSRCELTWRYFMYIKTVTSRIPDMIYVY